MTAAIETGTDWVALAQQLGTEFAPRAAAHDADDSFVAENFDILKQHTIAAQPPWPCPCIRTWWPQRCGAGIRGTP